jgi:hypothetical protein
MLDFGPEHLCSLGGAWALSMAFIKYFVNKIIEKFEPIPERLVKVETKLDRLEKMTDIVLEHDRKISSLEAKNGTTSHKSHFSSKHSRAKDTCS